MSKNWVERGIEDAERISQARTALREAAAEAEIDGIDKILDQRASTYGKYSALCAIANEIKKTIHQAMARRGNHAFTPEAREALDMIAHKIARICNGDPSYIDNWDDIAGYAKLVADGLRGIER